jgi:hypothetical protein
MPVPVGAAEASATIASAWKPTFLGSTLTNYSGVTVRCKRTASEGLLVHVAAATDPAPSAADATDDEMYYVAPGDTFPLGNYAPPGTVVYLRGESDGAAGYRIWRVKN